VPGLAGDDAGVTATLADLQALERLIEGLPAEKLAAIAQLPAVQQRLGKWQPNPGPQTKAYYCEADELLFGGEAGGGKSDLLIGLAYNEAHRARILRRINMDASELGDRLVDILGHDNGYTRQPPTWRGANGKMIEFRGCEMEKDKQRYKGKARDLICVAKGTRVRLADGTYRPIEALRVGDMLATLEGPRRLEKVYPSQRKPCVEAVARDWRRRVVARQQQSTTHALWSGMSWTSADGQDGVYPSTLRRNGGTHAESSLQKCWSLLPFPSEKIGRFLHRAGCAVSSSNRRAGLAAPACDPQTNAGSGGIASDGSSSILQRLREDHAHQVPRQHSRHSTGLIADPLACVSECGGVDEKLAPASFWDRCLRGFRRYGGPLRGCLGLSTRQAGVQRCLLLQGDVERPSPSHWLAHGLERIRKCIRSRDTYAHPYTREKRPVLESGSVQFAALSYRPVGELDVYDLQVAEVRHYITDGGFINKNCYDELADFLESQYVFINTWNRSVDPKQRCRVVGATNGPTTAEGQWIVKRWAAWLDPKHPNPAKDGELRWYIRVGDVDVEFDGPGPHEVRGKMVRATSRTFIRSRLEDNPDLAETDYGDRLESLPEELRRVYRGGDFTVGLKDGDYQVIPTAWIEAAQARWTPRPPEGCAMTAMAVDVAPGGGDKRVIACRYGGWYAPLDVKKEVDPDGRLTAGAIVRLRRDNCPVVIDMGGGWGGDAALALNDNGIIVVTYMGLNPSSAKTRDGRLGFFNKRAATIWKFREALDPNQEGGSVIALDPSDSELKADLASFIWEPVRMSGAQGIKIEPKEDIKKRLGRSPDRGEAVVMCLEPGDRAVLRQAGLRRSPPKVVLAYANAKRRGR
jgi:hypothetical protein